MPLGTILAIASILWAGSEIVLARVKWAKRSETTSHDRFSIAVIWMLFLIGPVSAAMVASIRATRMPRVLAPYAFWGGLALIVAGIVLRWVAIGTLKRYFTVNVAIAKDHKLIDHGVYRIVRHPSYAGTLVSMIGLGLAFRNWVSFAIILVVTIAALSYRIAVEEQALTAALGDDYRAYAARTKRLIPGVF